MKLTERYPMLARVLVIAGVVAVLPLAVGFLLIQHSAKTRLSDQVGENVYWFAETAASAFDTAVVRELELIASLARSEAVTSALTGVSSAASVEALSTITGWSALYRDIAVLDAEGGLVHPASESWLAEIGPAMKALQRPRMVEVYAEMADGMSALTVVRPVRDPAPELDAVIGFVRAELDTERLFASVTDFRVGETGHACLFERDSGRLLAGRRADCLDEEKGSFARLEDLARAERDGSRYFLAGAMGPASFERGEGWLVGFARPQFSRSLPELDWVVAVEQSLAEAHAPLAPLSRELLTHFLGIGVLVIVLAAYISFKLERPIADTAVDLHATSHEPGVSRS